MSFDIYWEEQDSHFDAESDDVILDAALRSDVRLPHQCRSGWCGTCRAHMLEGRIHYDEFPLALTQEEADAGYILTCQAHPDTSVRLSVANLEANSPPAQRLTMEVRSVELLAPRVRRLLLRAIDEDAIIEYRPGQYLNILLGDDTARSFSLATAYAFGNEVELHISEIPDGRFTHDLISHIENGEKLEVEIPRGAFTLHLDDWRPMVFVATGTGFAPIRAMLESLLDDGNCPPVTLYWGERTEQDLYAAKELESWASRLFEFNFIPVLSRANGDWNGATGHVQDVLSISNTDLTENSYYICGSPQMVAETKAMLLDKNVPLEYIYSEGFVFEATPQDSSYS